MGSDNQATTTTAAAVEEPGSGREKQLSYDHYTNRLQPLNAIEEEKPKRKKQMSFGIIPRKQKEENADDEDDGNCRDGDVDDDSVSFHSHSNNNNGCGRGIVKDFKRTVLTHWKSEMINLNQTVVATTVFLYFACIAPAITFGAIYAKTTGNWIGAVEMIAATAWCGILYALVGGQPMMINGGTGPVLAFSGVLFSMSKSIDVPFLTFNAWVGLWVAIYLLIAAFVDLNRFMRYATRFTDEIFALLISAIFILNAIGSPSSPVGIYYYFEEDHKSHDKYEANPDYSYIATAFLSLILCIGTVAFAMWLKSFKFSPYGPNQLTRNVVHDFAIVASILVMSVIANVVFPNVKTESLNVPETFAPTYACCTADCTSNWPIDCEDLEAPFRSRPWFVDLWDLNGKNWVPFMAAGPAVLAFILVFLDDGITWHLINHPSHKLQHGDSYNYDTIIIALMVAVNSLLGLPWLVAATVRSLNHVHAMATKTATGKFLEVQESRLTGLGIHTLCLITIFALDLLKWIPMPVLYGVFLFMGLVSLGTNVFFSRILMFFKEPSRYCDTGDAFAKRMGAKRINYFTLIQLLLFVLLYVVKAVKTIAIAFPIVIALCIPIRLYLLPKFFTPDELILLDGEDEAIKRLLQGGRLDFEDNTNPVSTAARKQLDRQKTPATDEDGEITEADQFFSLVVDNV